MLHFSCLLEHHTHCEGFIQLSEEVSMYGSGLYAFKSLKDF